MSGGRDRNLESIRSALDGIPSAEREAHGQLVARHVGIVIEILAAEHLSRNRTVPVGCPEALTRSFARNREKSRGVFACPFEAVAHPPVKGAGCHCEDPLLRSDDPLDAVAAVVLGSEDRSGASRYFDREWRTLVSRLRRDAGDWESIRSMSKNRLRSTLEDATERPGVETDRAKRLGEALEYFAEHRYTDGATLNGLPRVTYERLADFLAGAPGINRRDGWWLVLTAFDKPVWPADPVVDVLLADMGLLDPDELTDGADRREAIEDRLSERQTPALHRVLAGHALKAAPTWCGEDCEIRKFSLVHRARCREGTATGPTVVDLFSGAGGLSKGFVEAGARITLAVDSDRSATDTYRLNHPELPHHRIRCQDIEAVLEDDALFEDLGEVDIVIGGPPCQSLSQAGYRSRLASDENYSILNDPRTGLYRSYVEMVARLEPSIILMENVEGIISEVGDSEIRVLDQIEQALAAEGYACEARLLDCSEFGIPQQRERVFLVGIRGDLPESGAFIDGIFDEMRTAAPEQRYSLRQGLSGLPRLRRGEGGNAVPVRRPGRPSEYVNHRDLRGRTKLCLNHQARKHPKAKDRELFDTVMEPGDTARTVKLEKDRGDLIDYDVGTAENPRFTDKYRMLDWSEPAPTVVAHLAKDANNFVLPDYYRYVSPDPGRRDPRRNRGVTPREAARLQSFPDDYLFLGPFTDQFRQIGNAVPPAIGYELASVVNNGLELQRGRRTSDVLPTVITEPTPGD